MVLACAAFPAQASVEGDGKAVVGWLGPRGHSWLNDMQNWEFKTWRASFGFGQTSSTHLNHALRIRYGLLEPPSAAHSCPTLDQ